MLLLVIKTFELLINQKKKNYFLTYAVNESQGQRGQNIKL